METKEKIEHIKKWLELDRFRKKSVCPFDYWDGVGCYDDRVECRFLFKNLKDHQCPCTQYLRKYVERVAKKFIKDREST
jgi:hypothetical protein